MGVPAFYRWISGKYTKIVSDVDEAGSVENKTLLIEGPRANDSLGTDGKFEVKCDNLYLDLNGVIHPCVHPAEGPAPVGTRAMYDELFKYIDRIVDAVNPKQLLYLAIDGVSPRAKMNQQRSRRYKSSKEQCELKDKMEKERERFIQEYPNLVEKLIAKEKAIEKQNSIEQRSIEKSEISPGTEFMYNLSIALKEFIALRTRGSNGKWNMSVIFSDARVSGEGEHKIMEYIRSQRSNPSYNPNTVHVVHGLDADLIMLSLATHEEHFFILREKIEFKPPVEKVYCFICSSSEHTPLQCVNITNNSNNDDLPDSSSFYKKFTVIDISVLREYLSEELKFSSKSLKWDSCKAINDWIFLCFFVGNDFLPPLPSLEIREGSLDLVRRIWSKHIKTWDSYLTNGDTVDIGKIKIIMESIASVESSVFKDRYAISARDSQRAKRYNKNPKINDSVDKKKNISSHLGYNLLLDRGVCLHNEGWLERYYEANFNEPEVTVEVRANITTEYIRGLIWVFKYYTKGCVSWVWYYPYHYAPFALDFSLVDQDAIPEVADLSQPYSAIEQLFHILPPHSASLIPEPLRFLLTDDDSPLKKYFPLKFDTDMEGKRFEWQGVALLPFVNLDEVREQVNKYYHLLSGVILEINKPMEALLYVGSRCPLYTCLIPFDLNVPINLSDVPLNNIFGTLVRISPAESIFREQYTKDNTPDEFKIIYYDLSVFIFKLSVLEDGYQLISKIIDGSTPYPKVISENDIASSANYTYIVNRPAIMDKFFNQHDNERQLNYTNRRQNEVDELLYERVRHVDKKSQYDNNKSYKSFNEHNYRQFKNPPANLNAYNHNLSLDRYDHRRDNRNNANSYNHVPKKVPAMYESNTLHNYNRVNAVDSRYYTPSPYTNNNINHVRASQKIHSYQRNHAGQEHHHQHSRNIIPNNNQYTYPHNVPQNYSNYDQNSSRYMQLPREQYQNQYNNQMQTTNYTPYDNSYDRQQYAGAPGFPNNNNYYPPSPGGPEPRRKQPWHRTNPNHGPNNRC